MKDLIKREWAIAICEGAGRDDLARAMRAIPACAAALESEIEKLTRWREEERVKSEARKRALREQNGAMQRLKAVILDMKNKNKIRKLGLTEATMIAEMQNRIVGQRAEINALRKERDLALLAVKHANDHADTAIEDMRSSEAAETHVARLSLAIMGLIPTNRSADELCWCHHSRNIADHGHSPACERARAALKGASNG